MVTLGVRQLRRVKHKSTFWNSENVLYFDLGGDYTGTETKENHQALYFREKMFGSQPAMLRAYSGVCAQGPLLKEFGRPGVVPKIKQGVRKHLHPYTPAQLSSVLNSGMGLER